ncbi:uncharacterized protein N0V89_007621 [Didymosphaeria variabile]|uniref:C2H2-type domain-containing protein n=1 Tax=Didymosphaeria variabile TaxID=1932322 RepID=A0A9W8XJQ4_9PLEO|nr:uncharacterized protein N0V89_007621 [Didymosphaeria variabile]KAJ4352274.1 hypothetical protein N0V89_007621 [Didymosphaeria variabile]
MKDEIIADTALLRSELFCPKCDRYFTRYGNLVNHVQKKHGIGGNLLASSYMPRDGILDRRASDAPIAEQVCVECDKRYVYAAALANHLKAKHSTDNVSGHAGAMDKNATTPNPKRKSSGDGLEDWGHAMKKTKTYSDGGEGRDEGEGGKEGAGGVVGYGLEEVVGGL